MSQQTVQTLNNKRTEVDSSKEEVVDASYFSFTQAASVGLRSFQDLFEKADTYLNSPTDDSKIATESASRIGKEDTAKQTKSSATTTTPGTTRSTTNMRKSSFPSFGFPKCACTSGGDAALLQAIDDDKFTVSKQEVQTEQTDERTDHTVVVTADTEASQQQPIEKRDEEEMGREDGQVVEKTLKQKPQLTVDTQMDRYQAADTKQPSHQQKKLSSPRKKSKSADRPSRTLCSSCPPSPPVTSRGRSVSKTPGKSPGGAQTSSNKANKRRGFLGRVAEHLKIGGPRSPINKKSSKPRTSIISKATKSLSSMSSKATKNLKSNSSMASGPIISLSTDIQVEDGKWNKYGRESTKICPEQERMMKELLGLRHDEDIIKISQVYPEPGKSKKKKKKGRFLRLSKRNNVQKQQTQSKKRNDGGLWKKFGKKSTSIAKKGHAEQPFVRHVGNGPESPMQLRGSPSKPNASIRNDEPSWLISLDQGMNSMKRDMSLFADDIDHDDNDDIDGSDPEEPVLEEDPLSSLISPKHDRAMPEKALINYNLEKTAALLELEMMTTTSATTRDTDTEFDDRSLQSELWTAEMTDAYASTMDSRKGNQAWRDITRAAHKLSQFFGHSTVDHTVLSDQWSLESENLRKAFQTLHDHAAVLGVNQRRLYAAVRDDSNLLNSASLEFEDETDAGDDKRVERLEISSGNYLDRYVGALAQVFSDSRHDVVSDGSTRFGHDSYSGDYSDSTSYATRSYITRG